MSTFESSMRGPKIVHVVGARPNFMKIAPVLRALSASASLGAKQLLVHTGQHYDAAMSDVFFADLGLPAPDLHLCVGSGTQAEQTGKVMVALEKVFADERPDLVIAAGDVNSTLAASLVAAKACVPLAHVEAGLRSRDLTMPEEVNRIVTDRLAELLFTPSPDGDRNLLAEGTAPEKIHFVGNVMIDSLRASLAASKRSAVHARLDIPPGGYALVTLHRPANVDDPAIFPRLLDALLTIASQLPVVFPVHPRTRKRIAEMGLAPRVDAEPRLRLTEPFGYLDFLALTANARLVLTDSGGIQEETTALSVPCLTLRENTERPVTVDEGTNVLVGRDPARIVPEAEAILSGRGKRGRVPDKWDGRAAERIADVIERWWRATSSGRA